MAQFTAITSRVIPLPVNNIDTDQIIPARFLKVTDKLGLGQNLFCDWRYLADGSPNPEFILNRPEHQGAQILLAGDNFGCDRVRPDKAARVIHHRAAARGEAEASIGADLVVETTWNRGEGGPGIDQVIFPAPDETRDTLIDSPAPDFHLEFRRKTNRRPFLRAKLRAQRWRGAGGGDRQTGIERGIRQPALDGGGHVHDHKAFRPKSYPAALPPAGVGSKVGSGPAMASDNKLA